MMDRCRNIGRVPIRIKDAIGFAANRIFHAMWIEAKRLEEEGMTSPEDIDTALKLGLGHSTGPYALMNLASNDLNMRSKRFSLKLTASDSCHDPY